MQGKTKEASGIYAEALKSKPNDVALTAVASNNLIAINKDQNMFDSKKKIRAATAEACEHKLTTAQKKTIALNNCLLALLTNQVDLHLICNRISTSYPDLEFQSVLIRSSQLAKDQKYKEAIENVEKYSNRSPRDTIPAKFAIIQLLLLSVSDFNKIIGKPFLIE